MNDDLDRLLDRALSRYVEEPRAGLERRILARMRAEAARRRWWVWGVGSLAVALSMVVLMVLARPKERERVPAVSVVAAHSPATVVAPALIQPPRLRAVTRMRAKHETHPSRKEEVFPSRSPLTGEERALLAMVSWEANEKDDRSTRWIQPVPEQLGIEEIRIEPLKGDGE